MKRSFLPIFFLTLFILLFFINQANASVILKKSFSQVIQGSELIFEGRVVSKETRPSPINDMPFTYFTFGIIDIVEGDYPDQTIELGFMGGPKGDLVLKIADMRMPEVGERGIYFVTTLNEQYVHPLTGWHQGHYLIMINEQTDMNVVVPVTQQEVLKSPSRAARLLTVEDFKENIRNVIGREQ